MVVLFSLFLSNAWIFGNWNNVHTAVTSSWPLLSWWITILFSEKYLAQIFIDQVLIPISFSKKWQAMISFSSLNTTFISSQPSCWCCLPLLLLHHSAQFPQIVLPLPFENYSWNNIYSLCSIFWSSNNFYCGLQIGRYTNNILPISTPQRNAVWDSRIEE